MRDADCDRDGRVGAGAENFVGRSLPANFHEWPEGMREKFRRHALQVRGRLGSLDQSGMAGPSGRLLRPPRGRELLPGPDSIHSSP